MGISMIVAVENGGGIGLNGKLPWHVPAELAHFHRTVADMAPVCGVKTYPTLPKALRKRTLVWSERGWIGGPKPLNTNAIVSMATGSTDVAIIGGAATYAAFLPYADRILLSWIHADFEVDTYFPYTSTARRDRVFEYRDITKWVWSHAIAEEVLCMASGYKYSIWELTRAVQPCP
jgi:dihydrofolate reductase